ncbi:bacteriochlorophyll 4-vinyl reductase [Falsiroseomonas sp. CW058]|uniref:bacteriochlorophyll 4-vinyl reductase n=1 Tax=Falsiroseomonas sp. CW058 TaxID=3388664 RepID=UPI003D32136F
MDGTILSSGRIGPNAVTRLAEALAARHGAATCEAVFAAAGQARHLLAPPGRMVPEGDVTALHRTLRAMLGAAAADGVARDAGRLTARYLLAHRIPRALQAVLRRLPPALAARLLLGAIGRHAWTFAGSGSFRSLGRAPLRLAIRGGPIARAGAADHPACGYYAATFETLFRALVSPHSRAEETECEACGAPDCIFELRW